MFSWESDIAMTDPEVPYWTSARKAVIHNLKAYDTGLERLEDILSTATQEVMDKVADMKGEPFDINMELYNYTMKMIFYFTTGMSLTDNDPSLLKLKEMDTLFLSVTGMRGQNVMLNVFPFLRYFGNEVFGEMVRTRELMVELWHLFKA